MAGRGGGRQQKTLLPPINLIFKLLQQHAPVCVWLYEQTSIRIEGKLRGFDEFMNLVIDDAIEITLASKDPEGKPVAESRRGLGQVLLKGDNVSVMHSLQ